MKKNPRVYNGGCVFRLTGAVNLLLTAVIVYNAMAILGFAPAYGGEKRPLRSAAVAVAPREDYTNDAVFEGWQLVRMRVTAYCPCEKCCGGFADGETASGHKISQGDCFAAAGKHLAFGTDIMVPGYNADRPVKVLDRGGVITGSRLDVFFATHEQALDWGVRYLDVMVKG